MTDPNNMPQQVDQMKRDLRSEDSQTQVADVDMQKDYEIAKENTNGDGDQPSNPNPVTRQAVQEGRDTDSNIETSAPSLSHDTEAGNPDKFSDMAKDVQPE